MSTKYPGGIDDNTSLPNPGSTDNTLNSNLLLQHHYQHDTENDALKAIETKLGTGASTPPGAYQILISTANGVSSWGNLPVGGDLTGSLPNPALVGTGVAAGTYGSSTQVPVFTVDGKGRITSASNVNVVGGGGGGASPLTTKGDIWVYSTTDTRLPVGADTFILAADSTQATGLKWVSPPSSAVWGNITGTLSSQTDLQTALNAKAAKGANSDITSLSGLTTPLSVAQGGTGQSSTSIAAKNFFASPNGSAGSPTFRAIVASDIPTLNQNTTGSAATLTTGRTIQTNLASTSAATFDGSANITPGVTGTLPVLNGGTGATTSTGSGSVVLQAGPTITGHPTIEGITSTGATGSGKFVFDTSPVITTGTVAADPVANLGIASKQYVDKLATSSLVQNETPGGSVNGSNTAFTTASTYATGSLRVYLNGQRLTAGAGNDYVEGTQAFTMQYAPATGDVMLVDYNVSNTAFIQGSNSIIVQETPSGTVNGSTTLFTVLQGKYVANTLEVFVNGVQQTKTTDYTETSPGSGTFTFVNAPYTGEVVKVSYQFATGASGNADTVDGVHASAVGGTAGVLTADDAGWLTFPGTLTFASSTTFNTPADYTSFIGVGDKLRWKDGGSFKYAYVTAITSTILTLYAGTDFTIANATITNAAYSKVSNPNGFQHWFTYAPSISAASGTITSTSINTAKFSVVGRTCNLILDFTITNNGTGASAVTATLPITSINAVLSLTGRERGLTGSGINSQGGTTSASFFTYNNSYPGGTNAILSVSGSYQI